MADEDDFEDDQIDNYEEELDNESEKAPESSGDEAENSDDEDVTLDIDKVQHEEEQNQRIDYVERPLVIRDPKRITTTEHMFTTELSKIVSVRACQIDAGNPIYIDPGNLTDSIQIAEEEIRQGCCPLSLRRQVAPKEYEEIPVNTLISKLYVAKKESTST